MFTFMAQPQNKMQIPTIYPTKQLDQTGRGQHTSTEVKATQLHARIRRPFLCSNVSNVKKQCAVGNILFARHGLNGPDLHYI